MSDEQDEEIIIIRRITVPRRKLTADEQCELQRIETASDQDQPLADDDRWILGRILSRAASRP